MIAFSIVFAALGEPEDPQAPILVVNVNVPARVDQHVLGLANERGWKRPIAMGGRWREEIRNLARLPRIRGIDNTEPRIEVGKVDDVVRVLGEWAVPVLVLIVGTEAPVLLAKVIVGKPSGWHRHWQER